MSRLLPATLAVAALLLGAIVWELQDVAGPDPGTPSGRSSAVPVARAAPEAEPGDVLQGWVATALERPLFRTDRRPPKGADEVARGGDEPLRLTGVITGPFGNRAIFRSGESAKPYRGGREGAVERLHGALDRARQGGHRRDRWHCSHVEALVRPGARHAASLTTGLWSSAFSLTDLPQPWKAPTGGRFFRTPIVRRRATKSTLAWHWSGTGASADD